MTEQQATAGSPSPTEKPLEVTVGNVRDEERLLHKSAVIKQFSFSGDDTAAAAFDKISSLSAADADEIDLICVFSSGFGAHKITDMPAG